MNTNFVVYAHRDSDYLSAMEDEVKLLRKAKISDLNVENGRLVKKSICDRLAYFFNYKGAKKNIDESVSDRVIQVIQEIRDFQLKRDDSLPHKLEINEKNMLKTECTAHKIVLDLCKKIKFLKGAKYSRISELFNNEFQNYLNPLLKELRQEKKERGLKDDPQHKMSRYIAKSALIYDLGIGERANKGTTGTVVIEYFSKKVKTEPKKIAIFKKSNPDVKWSTYLANFFKRYIFGQQYYLSKFENAQPYAEVAAYQFSEKFNIKLVPPTVKVMLQNQLGSLQLFVKNKIEFKEIYKDFNKRNVYTEDEVNLFQKMMIFDYAIGNLDRHLENILVEAKGNRVVSLTPIDQANSFLAKAFNAFIAYFLKNQYAWRNYNIAKIPFTEESKALVAGMSEDQINAYIGTITQHLDGFLKENMKKQFEHRIQILRNMVNENHTPAKLGNIRTQSAIEEHLNGD